MQKVITKEIRAAIIRLLEYKSTLEVERLTGIRNQTIGKYRSGGIRRMSDRTWSALYPVLEPYLPEELRNPSPSGGAQASGVSAAEFYDHIVRMEDIPDEVKVRLYIELRKLAGR